MAKEKIKIVQANSKGFLHCPFCKAIIKANVFCGDSCVHLFSKDSTGEGIFKLKEDK